MKLKNNIFIIDSADYFYPYTQYFSESLVKENFKVFFFTRYNSRYNSKKTTTKKLFYFLSDFFLSKNNFFLFLEHLYGMILFLFYLIIYRPKNVIFQSSPVPVIDLIFILLIKKFVKLSFVMHNTEQLHHNGSFFQIIGYNKFFIQFDKIICHSKKTERFLISSKLFKKNRVLTYEIPLFSKIRKFINKKDITQFNILFFGFIRHYKGLDTLLLALSNLKNKNISLTIAGKPLVNLNKYYEIINNNNIINKVSWDLGYKNDYEISKLFNKSNLVVLPYRNIDASGIVNLCFTFCTPVILSDIEGFKCDYKKSSGIIFAKVNNSKDFSKKILNLFNSKKKYKATCKKIKNYSNSINSWAFVASRIKTFLEVK
jgi:glycosyltransferase involved in cell wall biosynthesis